MHNWHGNWNFTPSPHPACGKLLPYSWWLEMSEVFGSGTWLASVSCCLRQPLGLFLCPQALFRALPPSNSLSSTADLQLQAEDYLSFLGNFEIWHSRSHLQWPRKREWKTWLSSLSASPQGCWSPLPLQFASSLSESFQLSLRPPLSRQWAHTPPAWSVVFLYHIVALSATNCRLIRS